MNFADLYLGKQNSNFQIASENPSSALGCCIVIPCYNEDKLFETLDSLWNCERPVCDTEVILVVNSSESDAEEIINCNRNTIHEFWDWEKLHHERGFRFYLIHTPNLPVKHAGAGLARKIGMDIAISRFNKVNKPDGIIISLDADCKCSNNYLTEVESVFSKDKSVDCGILYFEHPLTGQEYSREVYAAIVQYELYLRCHIEYLRYIGYPYAFHTLGSCFAVKAETYVKMGGMNRRKAGEDFYFLHKLFASGHTVEINNVTVNPSPRPSDRVVFGTGAVIKRLVASAQNRLNTYNPRAYNDLKQLIDLIPVLFETDEEQLFSIIKHLPESISNFMLQNDFLNKTKEVKQNTAGKNSFTKRFYTWFSPLMVVRYLNYVHQKYYSMCPVNDAAKELLDYHKIIQTKKAEVLDLLEIFRQLQKNRKLINPF